jgi:hypothetical protein
LENFRNIMMALAIAVLTAVSLVQDAAIVRSTVTIRELTSNPCNMHEQPQSRSNHKKYHVSDN